MIAVSGSIGKTSTKDAVACAVTGWRRTAATIGNQNDELGVPLSIVRRRPSGRNLLGWAATMRRAARLASDPEGTYAECLVLELAGCHTGDIECLLELVRPDIGVLTGIEATHLESYGSLEAIEQEEGKVIRMLAADGVGVVNCDSRGTRRATAGDRCRILTYGFGDRADVRAVVASSAIDWSTLTGSVTLRVRCGGADEVLILPGTVGRQSCYAPLAAVGVGEAIGIPPARALRALRSYAPPPGRMRCRAGASGAMIVDDTYNSSPAAAARALETLAKLAPAAGGRRIAVLGPMAELGPAAPAHHAEVGGACAHLGIDLLCTVGEPSRTTARAAREAGMPAADVLEWAGCGEATVALRRLVAAGDVVLVKGSQAARLDRVVRGLTTST